MQSRRARAQHKGASRDGKTSAERIQSTAYRIHRTGGRGGRTDGTNFTQRATRKMMNLHDTSARKGRTHNNVGKGEQGTSTAVVLVQPEQGTDRCTKGVDTPEG